MAEELPDIKTVFSMPEFRQLPAHEKIKALDRYPDFQGLPLKEKAKAVQMGLHGTPMKPKDSFFGTLLTDVANLAAPIMQAGLHPIEAVKQLPQVGGQIVGQQKEMFRKAAEERKQGHPIEAGGYELAGTLPVVGPAAAQAGEEFREGRWRTGAAHTVELLAPEAAKPVVRFAKPVVRFGKAKLGSKATAVPTVEAEAIKSVEPHVDLSVGQRTHRPGLQKIERQVLTNLPGSEKRATEFFLRQQEQLANRGRQLAGEVSKVRANAYESGQGLQQRLGQRINRLKGYADQIYDSVRQETAAAKQTVQTGTRQSSILGPGGQPVTQPVYSVLETPVDLQPMRKALTPIYEDLTRAMPEARRANSPAYTALKDLMTSNETHMNAMDFDRSLSAIKALARDGESPFLSTKSQRVAKQIITEGETQLKQALGKVSPDLEAKLTKGRNAVRSYHETAELLQDLHSEPSALYHNLTTGGDRVFDTLKDLNRMAPKEVRTVGRTYLEGMIDKATAEGGFARSAGVMADWKRMGPETKKLLFGPQLTKELDQFFLAAKKLAPAEGSATAGRMAAFAPYALAGEVVRGLATGGLEMGAKELAGGIGAAYVMPNIAARVLFTQGGPSLLTRALTSPVGTVAFREAARAVGARAALAQKQEREDRSKSAGETR
jgi:hypothetical protein